MCLEKIVRIHLTSVVDQDLIHGDCIPTEMFRPFQRFDLREMLG